MLLVNAFGQSRVAFAMSRDGLLPPLFSRLGERVRTPSAGIIVFGMMSAVGAALLPLSLLGDLTSLGVSLAFATVCFTVIWLRNTRARSQATVQCAAGWILDRTRLVRLGAGRRDRALRGHGGAGCHRHRRRRHCVARCCRS